MLKIYLLNTECLSDAALFEKYYSLMPSYRREKIDRIRFDKDKRLSLGAGILFQTACDKTGIPDNEREIILDSHEKPLLKMRSDIFFNLSHSGTMAMCAIADAPVGCDIERQHEGHSKIADRFFSSEERQLLASFPNEASKRKMFFRLWTLKESFIKATGEGLSRGLDSFSVIFDNHHHPLLLSPEKQTAVFYEISVGEEYSCSCCVLTAEQVSEPEVVWVKC